MGQKVNPHGMRVGVIKNWDSRWFANDSTFGDTLVEDYNLRKYLKKALFTAGIAKVEIERDDKRVRLWQNLKKASPSVYKRIRYFSKAFFMALPGKVGNSATRFIYRIARKVYKFN